MATDRSNAMDHVVVVLFENRSLDNMLGHLYGPEDGKTFEGVIGKDLSNPIPDWAEDGADRKVVPYTVATDMDSPNPDSGEEYPHTNTQLYNILNEANRFKARDDITAPYNAPAPGQTPDDGRVRHRLHQLLHRRDGPPADLRGVRADHDRVHPRAGPGAQRAGPRVRGVRPLVLRGPVPDVAQPVVLDRGHVVGLRVEHARQEVHHEQQRRDDLQPARRPRQDVEGLRQRAPAVLLARADPLPAAQGSVRDALRAVLAVRSRCRERRPARLLVHRAVHR